MKSIIAAPSNLARLAPINAFLATPLIALSSIKSIDLILKSIAAATGASAGAEGAATGAELLNPSKVFLILSSSFEALSNSPIMKSIIAAPSNLARLAPIKPFLAIPLTILSFIKSIDLILKSIAAAVAATVGAVIESDLLETLSSINPSNFSPLILFSSLAFLSSK